MTAAGRLWRRAPLWRLLLATTLVFGVLSAVYPTPLLHLPSWPHRAAAPPGRATVRAIATPIEPPQHDTIRLAGRVVPLPAGDWHELVAGRVEDTGEESGLILARWQSGVLTGFLTVVAFTGSAAEGRFATPAATCDATGAAEVRWSDMGQTCWMTRGRRMPSAIAPAVAPPKTLEDAALHRVRVLGLTIPAWLSTTVWTHGDGSNTLTYKLSVVDAHAPHDGAAALAALGSWMTRFAPLLRRGYDDRLDPATVRTVARDPGFGGPPAEATHSRG